MKYKITTLKNGLRIITVPMHDTQTVTVAIAVGVGSRFESEKEAGLSHFLEHMMLKGTKKRPSWSDIAKEIDAVGGYHNAYTSKDTTVYFAKVDAKHFDVAFDLVSDIFLNSTINPKEIKKERDTIIQEMKMYEDDPKRKIGDLFEQILYGKNPLGRDIVGYKKTLRNFKRKDFLNYVKKHYTPNETVVCLAGKINENKAISEAKKYFSVMKKRKGKKMLKIDPKNFGSAVKIEHKKTEQTTFIIGNHAYDENHKDRFVLNLISVILGGNTSSRLFSEIREKRGLAYYVVTNVEAFADCGYIATQAGVEHFKLTLALKTILDELKKIASVKISTEELRRAKDYVKGASIMGLESSDAVAMFYTGQAMRKNKIMNLSEKLKKIEAVTSEDILRVAKDIFKSNTLNLAVIGPHKDGKKLQKLLKL